MTKPTINKYFDKRKPQKDNIHPIKIRVTYDRISKYYFTGIRMSKEEFDKTFGIRTSAELKKNKLKIEAFEKKANDVIEDMGSSFTFEQFEKHFLQNRATKNTLEGAFDFYISTIEENRPGTISAYECAKKSFASFKPKAKIIDVNVKFLNSYEEWMKENNKSVTTIGMYSRALRSLINSLIREKEFALLAYPFGKGKYEIPTGKNTKKALTMAEISKVLNFECTSPEQQKALDYWTFIFLCNGLNVADFSRLNYKSIDNDTITFQREKTKRTKKEQKKITASLQPQMKDIINKYGQKTLVKDAYIFPIINKGMTPQEAFKSVKNCTRLINKYMAEIAESLGINKVVQTMTARHSFATLLRNSGLPVSMISNLLDHSNVLVTENYLGSLEIDKIKESVAFLGKIKTEVI